jgi:hypothetical protein
MSFRALQHLQQAESLCDERCRLVGPPSGFGYPLDGFVLGQALPTLFQIGSAPELFPSESSPSDERYDIPAARTHMSLPAHPSDRQSDRPSGLDRLLGFAPVGSPCLTDDR